MISKLTYELILLAFGVCASVLAFGYLASCILLVFHDVTLRVQCVEFPSGFELGVLKHDSE